MNEDKSTFFQLAQQRQRLLADALHEATVLEHHLPAPLLWPPELAAERLGDLDAVGRAAYVDYVVQVERATVSRVLRTAGQFADWLACGKSEDEINAELLRDSLDDFRLGRLSGAWDESADADAPALAPGPHNAADPDA